MNLKCFSNSSYNISQFLARRLVLFSAGGLNIDTFASEVYGVTRPFSAVLSTTSVLVVVLAFYVIAAGALQSSCCILFSLDTLFFLAFLEDASKESMYPQSLLKKASKFWLLIGWYIFFAISLVCGWLFASSCPL